MAQHVSEKSGKAAEVCEIHPPVHPGEVLREEFMVPLGLTAYGIAKACRITRSKVERIVREDLGISGDTAVSLSRYFGTSPQFWANLQATYDVQNAIRVIGETLGEIEPLRARAA
ncbi:MAG: HigA family addiction module antitoxin [Microvirga sp.]